MSTKTGLFWTFLGPGPDGQFYGWADGQNQLEALDGDLLDWVNLTTFMGTLC